MKQLISLLLLLLPLFHKPPIHRPNCEMYEKNTPCYQACEESYRAISYPQGSRNSQIHFDKAIELCESFAYAYHEKAVPYLKRGDFIAWRALMDKAVALEPEERLGYRGWCRYQFLRDYQGAIDDIERLDEMVGYDIGYAQNGDCHLIVAKALAYKGLGQHDKALAILEAFVADPDFYALPYDLLHLGVMYLEKGELNKALETLNEQNNVNPQLADNYYYLAKVYQALGNIGEARKQIAQCIALYDQGLYRKDVYTTPMDAISRAEVEALARQTE